MSYKSKYQGHFKHNWVSFTDKESSVWKKKKMLFSPELLCPSSFALSRFKLICTWMVWFTGVSPISQIYSFWTDTSFEKEKSSVGLAHLTDSCCSPCFSNHIYPRIWSKSTLKSLTYLHTAENWHKWKHLGCLCKS